MEYAGHELVTVKPWLGVPCVTLLCFASVVGTFGNVIIIVVMSLRKSNSVESIFMINLALSDLYVTIVADPMSVVGE